MINNDETAVATIAAPLKKNSGKILFFSGSNSTNSINQQLVTILAGSMQQDQTRLINLNDFPMPIYSEKEETIGIPAKTNELLELIDAYDLLVIAVPEHNRAVPAFFKNTLDWMSRARADYRALAGKEVILLSACLGVGGNHTLLNAHNILMVLGAEVIGALVLKQFQNHIHNNDGKVQITCNNFLSEFENLVALSAIKASIKNSIKSVEEY